ncbi:MAG: hypothetical protein ACREP4_01030 [Stenotrophomonas sp.]|uniref:hypothetical protein n=1 Tax=Stenotrophomonas sp. TaxID=69392 RepID=UPI003D6C875F
MTERKRQGGKVGGKAPVAKASTKASAGKSSVAKAASASAAKADLFQQLSNPPKSSDLFLWCDYVEIRCLVHPDKRFSRQNLLESLAELDAFALRDGEEEEVSDAEDDASLEEGGDGVELGDNAGEGGDPFPISDRRESKLSSIYSQLGVRAELFQQEYPFQLDDSLQEIQLKDSFTSGGQGLYLQLLLSASLRLVALTRRAELTNEFENIAAEIFRGLMPLGWEVHQFGAKSAVRYKGHLFNRLSTLAADWRGELALKKAHFKTRNSGDGGLDLVAWHPLGADGRVGVPLAAAQCGCTAEEWSLKQLEASPSKLPIRVQHPWATYYFMPQDLIGVIDGQYDWQRRNDLAAAIVIDRLRIVRLARQFETDTRFLTLTPAVQEARRYQLV